MFFLNYFTKILTTVLRLFLAYRQSDRRMGAQWVRIEVY